MSEEIGIRVAWSSSETGPTNIVLLIPDASTGVPIAYFMPIEYASERAGYLKTQAQATDTSTIRLELEGRQGDIKLDQTAAAGLAEAIRNTIQSILGQQG